MNLFYKYITEEDFEVIRELKSYSQFEECENINGKKFNIFIFHYLKSPHVQVRVFDVLKLYTESFMVTSSELFMLFIDEIFPYFNSKSSIVVSKSHEVIKSLLNQKYCKANIRKISRFLKDVLDSDNYFTVYQDYFLRYLESIYHDCHEEYTSLLNLLCKRISNQSNKNLLTYIDILMGYMKYQVNEPIHQLNDCALFIMQALRDKNFQFSDKCLKKILQIAGLLLSKFSINWIKSDNETLRFKSTLFLQNFSVLFVSFSNVTQTIGIKESYDLYPLHLKILIDYLHTMNEHEVDYSTEETEILGSIMNSVMLLQTYIKTQLIDVSVDLKVTDNYWYFINIYWLSLDLTNPSYTELCVILNQSLSDVIKENIDYNLLFGPVIESIYGVFGNLELDEHYETLKDTIGLILTKYETQIIETSQNTNGIIKYMEIVIRFIKRNKITSRIIESFINQIFKLNSRLTYPDNLKVVYLELILEYYFVSNFENILQFEDILVDWSVYLICNSDTYKKGFDMLKDKLLFPLAHSESMRNLMKERLENKGYKGAFLKLLS